MPLYKNVNQETWVLAMHLSLTSHATLDRSFNFPSLSFVNPEKNLIHCFFQGTINTENSMTFHDLLPGKK